MNVKDKVLEYWFGTGEGADWLAHRMKLWFGGTDETNERLRVLFETDLRAAAGGAHDDLAATATGRLALIVLLDQFTRNVFRKTGRMFDNDVKALELAIAGIELGHDQAVPPLWRFFFYMPFEHSEEAAMQARSVCLFEELAPLVDAVVPGNGSALLGYARKHRDVIARFGRFAHRNALLGRTSTAEEQRYLADGGGFI